MDAFLIELLLVPALLCGAIGASFRGGAIAAERGHFRDRIFIAAFVAAGVVAGMTLFFLPKVLAVLLGFGSLGLVPRRWPQPRSCNERENTACDTSTRQDGPVEAEFVQRRTRGGV